jgi:hypothetical protein
MLPHGGILFGSRVPPPGKKRWRYPSGHSIATRCRNWLGEAQPKNVDLPAGCPAGTSGPATNNGQPAAVSALPHRPQRAPGACRSGHVPPLAGEKATHQA